MNMILLTIFSVIAVTLFDCMESTPDSSPLFGLVRQLFGNVGKGGEGGSKGDGCDTGYECPMDCYDDPCDCDDLSNCEVCHSGQGCNQCENGFFKKDYNSFCVSCQETFGDSCLHCGDFTGCQQCADGYTRVEDDSCRAGFYYCFAETCPPTQKPTLPEPTKYPTKLRPTPRPTDSPTPRWTNAPTKKPTIGECDGIEECKYSPCDCDEKYLHCAKDQCKDNGCNQCEDGYFKRDYNHKCEQCQEVYGEHCMFCQDFNGCGQCEDGYQRVKGTDGCDLWYCESKW